MRQERLTALLLVGTLLTGSAAIAVDAGSAGDPLISLSWLKDTFQPNAVSDAKDRVEERIKELEAQISAAGAAGTEQRVKRGDVIWLCDGAAVTALAGELSVSATEGDIIDTTAGELLSPSAGRVQADHRYLATENKKSAFSVTSDTAVIRLLGSYQVDPSAETDYNALADALKAMGLFQGSDVPYGSGYELEKEPTRVQGLIMFLRLMGEEGAALSHSSGVSFVDVPDWARPYVAYAYDKGYTKGQEVDAQGRVTFGTGDPLASRDYVTFLLRATGYAEGTDFQWLTAVSDAQALGVLTQGEAAMLQDKPFLRAQVAYLSYFALSAGIKGESGTLLDRLTAAGTVDSNTVSSAMSGLETERK